MLKTLILLAAMSAHADQPTYEVAYDTFTSYGVRVTSGSAREITDWTTLGDPGFKPSKVAGYRFQNQGASSIWYGNVNVSTDTAAGASLSNLGTKLDANDSSVEQVGYHTTSGQAEIYAQAEDDAGTTQVVVNVFVYGAE